MVTRGWRHAVIFGFVLCSLLVTLAAQCAEPTKVVIMSRTDYNYPVFDEYMIDRFHKENPDIVIELVGKSANEQQIKVNLAANNQLDIAVVDPHVALSLARDGLVADLKPYVQREPRFANYWYPAILEAYSYKGGLYGIPRDLQMPGVFYNVNAYQEAGLALPEGRWTYEDVKRNAIKLQKVDGQGNVTRWGWKLPTWRNWLPMIWGYGVDFVDSWTEPTRFVGKVPGMYEALGFMRSLVESGAIPDEAEHKKFSASAGLINGINAMVNTNTVTMSLFAPITAFTWDVAPAPYGPVKRQPFFNALSWIMLSSAKNRDAAWRVINYFTSEAAMEAMVELLGVIPPDRRYANLWLKKTPQPASKHVFFEDLDRAGYPGTLEADLYGIIEREVLAVVWGKKPIGTALENMEQLANARLAELKK